MSILNPHSLLEAGTRMYKRYILSMGDSSTHPGTDTGWPVLPVQRAGIG